MTVLSERVWQGRQSWDAERVDVTEAGRKIRATIHRDGYDEQSYGRVHIWTGDEWSLVLSRSVAELPLDGLSYVWDRKRAELPLIVSLGVLLAAGFEIVGAS